MRKNFLSLIVSKIFVLKYKNRFSSKRCFTPSLVSLTHSTGRKKFFSQILFYSPKNENFFEQIKQKKFVQFFRGFTNQGVTNKNLHFMNYCQH